MRRMGLAPAPLDATKFRIKALQQATAFGNGTITFLLLLFCIIKY
jgi:hypothetical protein